MQDFFDLLGIKGQVVAPGRARGAHRALTRHRYKLREKIASPIVAWFKASGLPIPDPADDTTTLAAAFLIGVSAMWISDILFEFIVRKFKPTNEE